MKLQTLAAELFQPGYRYWDVRPGFEHAWTIRSVQIAPAGYDVWRGGAWITPDLVTITRGDGAVSVFERGEQIAIQGPYFTR